VSPARRETARTEEGGARTTSDTIETLGRSVVQHGPHNDRVYLMKLHAGDLPGLVDDIEELAARNGYTKIFAKIPARYRELFEERGYGCEASVPGFFGGVEDAAFVCRYLSGDRRLDPMADEAKRILALAERRRGRGLPEGLVSPLQITRAGPDLAGEMSRLYAEVFPSYPFPIQDPGYLVEAMRDHVHYFCIRSDGRVVAVASSEVDPDHRNVEMTDFATLPSHRGRGLALRLLHRMEEEMRSLGVLTAYTIARAGSPGMNITFSRMGYSYGGLLVNNTNIGGGIEDMNVWYKALGDVLRPS